MTVGILVAGCNRHSFTSGAMAPTISPHERITISYAAYAFGRPERWDVIAFKPLGYSNQIWVMRVVGLPGETITFSGNQIMVNGKPIISPARLANINYVSLDSIGRTGSVSMPYAVPLQSYFVLGDSSHSANDSRYWGAVPQANIVGKVRNK